MILLQRRRAVIGAAATVATAYGARKLWDASAVAMPRVEALKPPVETVPAISFTTATGEARSLKDYVGTGIVLNFWATWCAPCVEEMPSLAKLAGAVHDDNVRVLPLSSDHGGAPVVERFYTQRDIQGLPILLDPHGDAARAFGSRGLPTTVLIDAAGRERGRYEGGADWTDPAAIAAVRELGRKLS